MHNYSQLAIAAVIHLALLFWHVNFCSGYVLEGRHILDLAIRSMGSPRTLQVTQKNVIPQVGNEAEAAELNEKIQYLFPEHFRSDISTDTGDKIYLFSG